MSASADQALPGARAELSAGDGAAATLRLAGTWHLGGELPGSGAVLGALAEVRGLGFDSTDLGRWDTGLVSFLTKVIDHCQEHGISVDRSGLPRGVQSLLRLAYAVPERAGARRTEEKIRFLEQFGHDVLGFVRSTGEIVAFLGEATLAFRRLIAGRARYRKADLAVLIQESGANALPIVSLISFLSGVILAYIGQAQLAKFGAKIYMADLVALAMVREMGAMMTGIILAGRTGAAFAAQLGTMTVNEEIDALRTLGMHPMDFLVLPRMLALMLMMPLLVVYSDLVGILGGAFIGVTVAGLTPVEFALQVQKAVTLQDVAGGLLKGFVYGGIVALSGCLRGMQCGRSAASVGQATTSAVVTAIVFIVVASAVLTVIYDVLGI